MLTGSPTRVTANAVVSASPGYVSTVTVGHADAGQTLKLHNCATVGAAANGNCMFTIPLDTPQAWYLGEGGVHFDVGVVAIVSGGTPDCTVVVL
jgi:hypothetical protein